LKPLPLARWSRRLVLVVALLLAQHAGALHALGHLFDKSDAAPGHAAHACCVVYQGLDHAPTAASPVAAQALAAPEGDFPPVRITPRQFAAAPYDSRAPPAAT
jgi:hypothetical protein